MIFADFQEAVAIVAGDAIGWVLAFFIAGSVLLALQLPILAFVRRWTKRR